jgi:hypothetical protein
VPFNFFFLNAFQYKLSVYVSFSNAYEEHSLWCFCILYTITEILSRLHVTFFEVGEIKF